MNLGTKLADFWRRFQGELFPALAEEVGPLLGTHRRLVAAALDLVGVEGFLGTPGSGPGRPPEDRRALARAFLAKAVWDLPTTRHLINKLGMYLALRLCGWSRLGDFTSEATFSRAFAEFSASRLAERMHEALVVEVLGEALIGHVSRDSTAIEGRQAAVAKPKVEAAPKRRPGRPRRARRGRGRFPVSSARRTA